MCQLRSWIFKCKLSFHKFSFYLCFDFKLHLWLRRSSDISHAAKIPSLQIHSHTSSIYQKLLKLYRYCRNNTKINEYWFAFNIKNAHRVAITSHYLISICRSGFSSKFLFVSLLLGSVSRSSAVVSVFSEFHFHRVTISENVSSLYL